MILKHLSQIIKLRLRFLTLIAACLFMLLRHPTLLSIPRFWAEEGSVFYSKATCTPWYVMLTQPFSGGYFALYNSLIALIAVNFVSIKNAPLFTTLSAFLVQCIPIIIVLWGSSGLYRSGKYRILIISSVIFNLYTGEIWLNTTNSQFYWLLITVLLLIEQPVEFAGRTQWVNRLLLLIAGLTSPTVLVLTPLFYIKARLTKNREDYQYFVLLLCTTCIQVSTFLWVATHSEHITTNRFTGFELTLLPYVIWSRVLITPILGELVGNSFVTFITNMRIANYSFYVGGAILLCGLYVSFIRFVMYLPNKHSTLLLIGSITAISIFTILTSATHANKSLLLIPSWSSRYFYVPSVLFIFVLISIVEQIPSETRKIQLSSIPYWILILSSITVGVINYHKVVPQNALWPNWAQEVTRLNHDPKYRPAIWPPGWTMEVCNKSVE